MSWESTQTSNVQPFTPAYDRVDNMPNKSTRLNESNDSDNGGFVFHQIGNVEIWCDEQENLRTLEDAGNGPWFTTTYAAVVKVNNSGASEGIYINLIFTSLMKLLKPDSPDTVVLTGDTLVI